MRTECLEYKYTYESHHPVGRLVYKVAESINNIKYIKES